MLIRKWAIAFGVGLCLSNFGSSIHHPAAASSHPVIGQATTTSDAVTPDAVTPDLSIENTLRFETRWPLITAYILGLGAIVVGLQQYRARCHWRRVECARDVVHAFQQRPGVRNILSILDFEEYRTQYYPDPKTGEIKSFQATDARLRRSLRDHDAMVKIKTALLTIDEKPGIHYKTSTHEPRFIDSEICQKYKDIEFPIEVTLRDWFDEFLCGLEDINAMIEAGLFTARDIKPFIFYWIQVIADRSVRRKGGASFYDPLFYYIHHSGYTGVESLFERYGYKVLPPPYMQHDFAHDSEMPAISFEDNSVYRALCCAKTSMLVYEDNDYMTDIVKLWLRTHKSGDYRQQTDEQFLAKVIDSWQRENELDVVDLKASFKLFNNRETDTQAFLFHKGTHIILIFRGTEKFEDWRTNLRLTLQKFQLKASQKSVPPSAPTPVGRVHRGFFNALKSIEDDIIETLDAWGARPQYDTNQSDTNPEQSEQTALPKLWVTGHSLGGALAALAAVSLKCQGFNVAGLYTFGQPRVGDWAFGRAAMALLNPSGNTPIERYVNNNDIVPLIPPGFVPWQPTRVYGHFGHFRYFDSSGTLQKNTFPGQRLPDRLWGFVKAMLTTGPDAVSDHVMEFYIANLQKAIEVEKETLKIEMEKKNSV